MTTVSESSELRPGVLASLVCRCFKNNLKSCSFSKSPYKFNTKIQTQLSLNEYGICLWSGGRIYLTFGIIETFLLNPLQVTSNFYDQYFLSFEKLRKGDKKWFNKLYIYKVNGNLNNGQSWLIMQLKVLFTSKKSHSTWSLGIHVNKLYVSLIVVAPVFSRAWHIK